MYSSIRCRVRSTRPLVSSSSPTITAVTSFVKRRTTTSGIIQHHRQRRHCRHHVTTSPSRYFSNVPSMDGHDDASKHDPLKAQEQQQQRPSPSSSSSFLVKFVKARLYYPNQVLSSSTSTATTSPSFVTEPIDFTIRPPQHKMTMIRGKQKNGTIRNTTIAHEQQQQQKQHHHNNPMGTSPSAPTPTTTTTVDNQQGVGSTTENKSEQQQPPQQQGGYALLGRNGSGKSLIGRALVATNTTTTTIDRRNYDNDSTTINPYMMPFLSDHDNDDNDNGGCGGRIETNAKWHSQAIAHVSFDSHQELLLESTFSPVVTDTTAAAAAAAATTTTTTTGAPRADDNDEGPTQHVSSSSSSSSTTKLTSSISAFKAITQASGGGDTGGRLNKAAQFLVVRFGLYPLLHRPVHTLSTGEIRKVLLIRALSTRPKVLILDNAFDGLDVRSRDILKDIVSRTIKGFTQDILVQDVSSKATGRTQVLLMTHRPEELVDEIDTVAWFRRTKSTGSSSEGRTHDQQSATFHILDNRPRTVGERNNTTNDNANADEVLVSVERESDGRLSGHDIMRLALGLDDDDNYINNSGSRKGDLNLFDWEDPTLPTVEFVQEWWNYGTSHADEWMGPTKEEEYQDDDDDDGGSVHQKQLPSSSALSPLQTELVRTTNLSIRRGDAILLHDLTWTVRAGERWIVGGGNGAGKSTLSRLLAHPRDLHDDDSVENRTPHSPSKDHSVSASSSTSMLEILSDLPSRAFAPVGWVSTESHLAEQLRNRRQSSIPDSVHDDDMLVTVRDYLKTKSGGAPWEEVIVPVLRWLQIDVVFTESERARDSDYYDRRQEDFLSRPFQHLSQGQQKLVLIASALSMRPPVLVLDEPCQGLDILNRRRVLTVVERICRSTDIALVYITHHFDEELLPCVSHALHLKDRRAVYQGPIEGYNPQHYQTDD